MLFPYNGEATVYAACIAQANPNNSSRTCPRLPFPIAHINITNKINAIPVIGVSEELATKITRDKIVSLPYGSLDQHLGYFVLVA